MFTTVLLAESELEPQRLVDEVQGVCKRRPKVVVRVERIVGRILKVEV